MTNCFPESTVLICIPESFIREPLFKLGLCSILELSAFIIFVNFIGEKKNDHSSSRLIFLGMVQ
jgi:hypothetical protein